MKMKKIWREGGGGLLRRSITGYNGTRCRQGLVQKSRVKFPKKSKSQQKLILNIFICEFTTKDITKRMSLMQNIGRRWTDDKINTEWSTESHDLKQWKQTRTLQGSEAMSGMNKLRAAALE